MNNLQRSIRFWLFLTAIMCFFGCENIKSNKTDSKHNKELKATIPDIDKTRYKSEVFSEEMLNSSKPVLIYFNSLACVNCRKMEDRIAKTEGLWDEINNRYKFINLYVDDPMLSDSSFWTFKMKKLRKKVGAINSYTQIDLTQSGSQPKFYFHGDTSNSNLIGYCNEYNFNDFIERIKK